MACFQLDGCDHSSLASQSGLAKSQPNVKHEKARQRSCTALPLPSSLVHSMYMEPLEPQGTETEAGLHAGRRQAGLENLLEATYMERSSLLAAAPLS